MSGRQLRLQVAEALPADVGRNLARLDPALMQQLGLGSGDYVCLQGRRSSCARVMPAPPPVRGRNIVQVDGITRQNLQCTLGEEVLVSPVQCPAAREVVLVPLADGLPGGEGPGDHLSVLLAGQALGKGERIRVHLFSASWQEFMVQETVPEGFVKVETTTRWRIEAVRPAGGSPGRRICYEDIGGLDDEVRRLREMVELPLRYPEVFVRLGIEPPRGLLLTGPPGTGKTLLARAVAAETKAAFYSISGPEVVAKYYGESEARLRDIFARARQQAPAIIFIDELDAIAPRRTEVHGEVEKRMVTQLLALLDGLPDRQGVVVIGATNLPDHLDPALRRPGRFDRELRIGPPDQAGRLSILRIHTRGMPLADDVDLEQLAMQTPGFVGADLAALCREAAMACLREAAWPGIWQGGPVPAKLLASLTVRQEHFWQARREVEPSALRQVLVEKPRVRWSDVGGLEQVKQILQEVVEWPLLYPHLYRELDISPPRGILLYGPPGTGKTLLARAVAGESQANFIAVQGPQLFSRWVGDTEKGIREIFRKARQVAPCVVFLDEIDALAPARSDGAVDRVGERAVGQLLAELDGLEELRGVTVLAATNRRDRLDTALLRAGRFDLHLEVPLPDDRARQQILAIHLHREKLCLAVDLVDVSRRTAGWSGADLALLCRRALMNLLRRTVQAGHVEHSQLCLEEVDLQAAWREVQLYGCGAFGTGRHN